MSVPPQLGHTTLTSDEASQRGLGGVPEGNTVRREGCAERTSRPR